MNPEQLLIPRYVVIADYPGSKFKVGQIIEFVSRADKEFSFTEEWFVVMDGFAFGETWFQQWPHIFKALQWWEARQKNDLTGYIKLFLNGEWRVFHIDITDEGIMKWQFGGRRPEEFQPATEQEYNQYKRKSGTHD